MGEEPQLKEFTITASAGGKISIIKYNEDSSYFVSSSQSYSVPEDWDEAQVEEFREQKYAKLREYVDGKAQVERDERFEQSYLSA